MLLQREIPESVNIQVARAAATAGVPVLLDGGGVDAPLSSELLSQLSIISPNETELQRLTGQPADSEAQALAAANDLQQTALKLSQQQESQPPPEQQQEADSQGQLRVLVKRGSAGSMMVGADGQQEALQPAVTAPKVVDTTGETCSQNLSLFPALSTRHNTVCVQAGTSLRGRTCSWPPNANRTRMLPALCLSATTHSQWHHHSI